MTIQRFYVQWVEVDKKCDKCDQGYMRPLNITLTSYPPQYPHRCNHCGANETFLVCYPHMDHTRGAQF